MGPLRSNADQLGVWIPVSVHGRTAVHTPCLPAADSARLSLAAPRAILSRRRRAVSERPTVSGGPKALRCGRSGSRPRRRWRPRRCGTIARSRFNRGRVHVERGRLDASLLLKPQRGTRQRSSDQDFSSALTIAASAHSGGHAMPATGPALRKADQPSPPSPASHRRDLNRPGLSGGPGGSRISSAPCPPGQDLRMGLALESSREGG
jgi:hypothetical protein